MNIKRLVLSVLFTMSVTCVAQGSEVGRIDLSGQRLLNPRAEIIVQKNIWEESLLDANICTGSEIQSLPLMGTCPYTPGYVTVGFPTCTQKFNIPKSFTVQEISPGFNRLICELDYTNATPVGEPICDYSQCLYVSIPEPGFPFY